MNWDNTPNVIKICIAKGVWGTIQPIRPGLEKDEYTATLHYQHRRYTTPYSVSDVIGRLPEIGEVIMSILWSVEIFLQTDNFASWCKRFDFSLEDPQSKEVYKKDATIYKRAQKLFGEDFLQELLQAIR